MRISVTGNDLQLSNRGFTILELLVVLVIMVMMTGIAAISIGPGIREAKMRTACRMIISALTYARSNAVSTGVISRAVFNDGKSTSVEIYEQNQKRTLSTSSGKVRYLPEGIEITDISKSSGGNEDWIEFNSLGQAESAVIKVESDSGIEKYIAVDAFTGLCRMITYDELYEKKKSE
ncbi:MAG: prepilin-type N-terminal cleavage/methylation domain-containing protein [Armatimonadota bacterium]